MSLIAKTKKAKFLLLARKGEQEVRPTTAQPLQKLYETSVKVIRKQRRCYAIHHQKLCCFGRY